MSRKTTEAFDVIRIDDLATVTGGCKKRGGCRPCCGGGGGSEVDVTVSTGGAQPPQGGAPTQSAAPQLM
jgi:hypothetical protein